MRFIPAGAGNTYRGPLVGPLIAVHPRRCGEHPCRIRCVDANSGSSPQVRGTLLLVPSGDIEVRFIPAGAGNTL